MAGFNIGIIDYNGVAGPTYATIDPSNKGGMLLTNGNLTFKGTGGGGFQMASATISKNSGKWYWEMTIVTPTGRFDAICGIINYQPGNSALGTFGESTPKNVLWYGGEVGAADAISVNFGSSTYQGTGTLASQQTIGQVIGMALDLGAGTMIFYVNGVQFATTITSIPTDTWWPAGYSNSGNALESGTFNFGASSFAYTVPSGYNAGVF